MRTEEVAPGVYRLEEDDGDRALCQFVVVGSKHTLVIDTGLPASPARGILPLLDQIGADVDPIVLLTHPDADHCGGTSSLLEARPSCVVIANAGDCDLLGDPERTITDRYLPFALSDDILLPEDAVDRMRVRLGGAYTVTRPLEHEETFDLGGRTCQILLVPGHSQAHAAAWIPETHTLIAGDAVMGEGIRRRDGTLLYAPQFFSPSAYRRTIDRVRDLDAAQLLCAHEPTREGAAVASFLDDSATAVDALTGLVDECLSAGPATLAAVCRAVHEGYGGLPAGRSFDLATTVAGVLAERAQTTSVVVDDSTHPRQFRLVSQ